MGAVDDLARIERKTNWKRLVKKALADPPTPAELAHKGAQWAAIFQVVHGGPPVEADYPEPLREFFRKLLSITPKRGRPRCDEQKLLAARRAWTQLAYKTMLDAQTELLAIAKENGGISKAFGWPAATIKRRKPEQLALENLSELTGLDPLTLRKP